MVLDVLNRVNTYRFRLWVWWCVSVMVSAVCHGGGTVDVCICLHVLFLTSASLSDV